MCLFLIYGSQESFLWDLFEAYATSEGPDQPARMSANKIIEYYRNLLLRSADACDLNLSFSLLHVFV